MRPRVWAPATSAPAVVTGGAEHPLQPDGDGWWRSPVDVPDGAAYAFRIDGDALPDPRSRSQPNGVHGPSAVDEAAFAWTDDGWRTPPFGSLATYELHIGTFSPEGTFVGAIPYLDRLRELGVGAISVMPVAEFAGDRGWGYDGVDLWAAHHAYGGAAGLRRLVDAAHTRGLAVILDVVYNHLGPEGNYLARFGPYFNDRHHTPWGAAINYDSAGARGVRDFVIENAIMWLGDCHLDGLRLDAVHAIIDLSRPHVLTELRQRVDREVGEERWLIAECDLLDPRIAGEWGLTAQWSDDIHHAIHSLLTGERSGYYQAFGGVEQLAHALCNGYVREPYGPVLGRPNGRRLVAYAQNHDQVGNRARGDRLCHLVTRGRSRIAAALVLLGPFAPMLFRGEEWAASTPFPFFSSHTDPTIGAATSEGRRREFAGFGWRPEEIPDPQDPATYEAAKLRWSERDGGAHGEMLRFHEALLELRREHPGLSSGDLGAVAERHGPDWLVLEHGGLVVACNWGSSAVALPVRGDLLLAGGDTAAVSGDRLRLGPDDVAVLTNGAGAQH
jgi:maltooligosyltrehalose trehalohydrolase